MKHFFDFITKQSTKLTKRALHCHYLHLILYWYKFHGTTFLSVHPSKSDLSWEELAELFAAHNEHSSALVGVISPIFRSFFGGAGGDEGYRSECTVHTHK